MMLVTTGSDVLTLHNRNLPELSKQTFIHVMHSEAYARSTGVTLE